MLPFRTEITRKAARAIRQLPRRDAERVFQAIKALADDPYPRGGLKLSGTRMPLCRLRVGEYRIIYSVANEAQLVVIEEVSRRSSQTYENLP